jgi:hypothetical protein
MQKQKNATAFVLIVMLISCWSCGPGLTALDGAVLTPGDYGRTLNLWTSSEPCAPGNEVQMRINGRLHEPQSRGEFSAGNLITGGGGCSPTIWEIPRGESGDLDVALSDGEITWRAFYPEFFNERPVTLVQPSAGVAQDGDAIDLHIDEPIEELNSVRVKLRMNDSDVFEGFARRVYRGLYRITVAASKPEPSFPGEIATDHKVGVALLSVEYDFYLKPVVCEGFGACRSAWLWPKFDLGTLELAP